MDEGPASPALWKRRIQVSAWVIACVPKVSGKAKNQASRFGLAQIYADFHGIVDMCSLNSALDSRVQ